VNLVFLTNGISDIALLIIAEHSFILWDQDPSDNPAYFTTAMKLYKESTHFPAVLQAVDKAFTEDDDASFKSFDTHARQDARKTLIDKLIQIALDNLMCMTELQSMQASL